MATHGEDRLQLGRDVRSATEQHMGFGQYVLGRRVSMPSGPSLDRSRLPAGEWLLSSGIPTVPFRCRACAPAIGLVHETLPLQYPRAQVHECRYLDSSTGAWSADGCVVRPDLSGDRFVACECDAHVTAWLGCSSASAPPAAQQNGSYSIVVVQNATWHLRAPMFMVVAGDSAGWWPMPPPLVPPSIPPPFVPPPSLPPPLPSDPPLHQPSGFGLTALGIDSPAMLAAVAGGASAVLLALVLLYRRRLHLRSEKRQSEYLQDAPLSDAKPSSPRIRAGKKQVSPGVLEEEEGSSPIVRFNYAPKQHSPLLDAAPPSDVSRPSGYGDGVWSRGIGSSAAGKKGKDKKSPRGRVDPMVLESPRAKPSPRSTGIGDDTLLTTQI